jgi:signal transduction histidine kinase
VELALFRIAQEALTNVAKHSGATAVGVLLSQDAQAIELAVEDDGGGFKDSLGARSAGRGGWGLPAMRERAEAHGGELRVELPGRGARIIVRVPLPDAGTD